MIVSFKDSRTNDIYHGLNTKKARTIPRKVWPLAQRKLDMLEAAHVVEDLRVPPGNHLELLVGALAGRWSIRINRQYRIVFEFDDTTHSASEVHITDYH